MHIIFLREFLKSPLIDELGNFRFYLLFFYPSLERIALARAGVLCGCDLEVIYDLHGHRHREEEEAGGGSTIIGMLYKDEALLLKDMYIGLYIYI